MKKLWMSKIIAIFACILLAVPAMATISFWPADSLTGGTSTSLDGISGNNLADGDGGFVVTTDGDFCVYVLDADSGASETSESPCPQIIDVDTDGTCGANCRWVLLNVNGDDLSSLPSADPTVTLRDSDNDAGTGKVYANSSGGTNDIIMYLGVEDSGGENQTYVELDGVSETVDSIKPFNATAGATVSSAFTATGLVGDEDLQSEDFGDFTCSGEDACVLDNIVTSAFWSGAGIVADGTQCANPAKVTINSGPVQYTIKCADNDGSSMYGHIIMPDSWNAGTVTFELEYLQTAADTAALHSDVCCQCRGATEVPSSTWGSEVAIDDTNVTGSNGVDHTTSDVVTCAGTCAAGDSLWWRVQLDAGGTTTAVATLHFLGMKMEYTTTVGD